MGNDINAENQQLKALLSQDPKVNNFDWLDLSLMGELTDKQKWSVIIQTDPIDVGPLNTHTLNTEARITVLKQHLFAYCLMEKDFTVDGVLKLDKTF